MIKKIQKIKNFGSFIDFTWDTGINDFKKKNLIEDKCNEIQGKLSAHNI